MRLTHQTVNGRTWVRFSGPALSEWFVLNQEYSGFPTPQGTVLFLGKCGRERPLPIWGGALYNPLSGGCKGWAEALMHKLATSLEVSRSTGVTCATEKEWLPTVLILSFSSAFLHYCTCFSFVRV